MFSKIWQTKKNFCDLESTLNKDWFSQYDILWYNHIFLCWSSVWFNYSFLLDKADKQQVMIIFFSLKSNRMVKT